MRVFFLTTHLNTGGISSYLLTLSKAMVRRGHGVHVISAGGQMASSFQAAGAQVQTVDIRTKSELSPKIYRTVGPVMKMMKEFRADMLHAHTRVTQVLAAVVHSLRRDTPVVTTCHGFFKPRWPRRLFPCWGDRVIAISSQVRDHLMNDFHVPEEKICLIPNGIDLDEFNMSSDRDAAQDRSRFHIPPGAQVVGIIARLSDVKGHDILIRSIPSVIRTRSNIRFLFIGEGKMEDKLKQLAAELKVSEFIHFVPSVKRTAQFLRMFDVFVMPSLQEGLGLSVIEAQAMGLPVVASRVGGLPSLIENLKTGVLVEPGNPEDLARGLIHVLENPALAAEMGARAREFARGAFSSDTMCDRTLKVYQEIAGGGWT